MVQTLAGLGWCWWDGVESCWNELSFENNVQICQTTYKPLYNLVMLLKPCILVKLSQRTNWWEQSLTQRQNTIYHNFVLLSVQQILLFLTFLPPPSPALHSKHHRVNSRASRQKKYSFHSNVHEILYRYNSSSWQTVFVQQLVVQKHSFLSSFAYKNFIYNVYYL